MATKVHPKKTPHAKARRSKTKETLDRMEKEVEYEAKVVARRNRTYDQILKEIVSRFNLYGDAFDALIEGEIRALIISGAPGIGKTHLAMLKLLAARSRALNPHRFEVAKGGGLSPINAFMMGWNLRHGGTALVDDADDVFGNEDTLNIIKTLTDSGKERYVSYRKEAQALADNGVEKEYFFEGGVCLITNINLDEAIILGRGAHVVHYEALMSRALYLDLRIQDRNEVGVWVSHIVNTTPLLQGEGIADEKVRKEMMGWILDNSLKLRNLDLRTPTKVAQIYKMQKGKNWKSACFEFLCRD